MVDTSEIQLINSAIQGDRTAYGKIVEQYQGLICSLTFSACRDFALSEDMAQETFIIAWKKLSELREMNKFKSWLCGIARNVTLNTFKKNGKSFEALHDTDQADEAAVSPEELAISKEEEILVQQTLENLPDNYRAPLVLFYRSDQSVAEVASSLDISLDTAKQRLSRGRAMLKDRIAKVVEKTLSRSRPGKAFTIATLAALPALATEAAAAGLAITATKGATTAGSIFSLSMLGAILGPILGLLGGFIGARASINSARSPGERAVLVRMSWQVFILSIIFAAAILVFAFWGKALFSDDLKIYGYTLSGIILLNVLVLISVILHNYTKAKTIFQKEKKTNNVFPEKMISTKPWVFKTKSSFLGFPLIHISFGYSEEGKYCRGKARGWIAIGDVSFGLLFSFGGIAMGGISFGGISAGLISFGGLSLGVLAIGGLAAGWMAFGGLALAVFASMGGFAAACDYAIGGAAFAENVNNEAANAILTTNIFFRAGSLILNNSIWIVIISLLPILVLMIGKKKR